MIFVQVYVCSSAHARLLISITTNKPIHRHQRLFVFLPYQHVLCVPSCSTMLQANAGHSRPLFGSLHINYKHSE
jgi:hypothetical protein